MKFQEFDSYLSAGIGPKASVKTSIRAELMSKSKWKLELERPFGQIGRCGRFVIFPVKIYTPKNRHLNVLILDQKTKTFERYEPHSYSHTTIIRHLDEAIENLLYQIMATGSIYFLKYRTVYGDKNDTNCGFHCIERVRSILIGPGNTRTGELRNDPENDFLFE
jgi:hypothetical protein